MAALSENVLIVSMLLSVVFLPGDLADCPSPFLFVDVPCQIEALSGSCLQIPCNFTVTHKDYDATKESLGIWYKNTTNDKSKPNPTIFKSDGSVNKYSLNMTGNLNEKNCTTLFPDLNTSYTDTYYLRIERGKFKANALCEPFHITVKDSPWSPSINISASDLKEHQSVTVTCSAFTPCPNSPPELTWTLQQDSLRQTERNTDGTFTTKIQKSINLSDTHDGYNISCSARYPVTGGIKTAETEVTLSVSYAPKNTSASISPSGLVSAGIWVELSCSSRAKPPPRFTWFRISKDGAVNVSVGQVYSFNATEGGEFYCVATNDLGNQTSSVICVNTERKGLAFNPLYWGIIPVGCIVFICLCAGFWYFKSKYRAPKLTQNQNSDVQMSDTKPEEQLHYGEIKFSRKTPVTSSKLQHNEQKEAVYAEVKVSQREISSKQTPENPTDLCCEEKKE